MKLPRRHVLTLALIPLIAGCAIGGSADRCYGVLSDEQCYGLALPWPPPIGAKSRLAGLIAEDWQARLADNPVNASALGVPGHDDRWPDLSAAALERRQARDRELLERARAIAPSRLEPESRLNHAVLLRQLEDRVAAWAFRPHLVPVTQRGGLQTANQVAELLPFAEAADYEHWIARLDAFGTYVDQHITLMRAGLAAGLVPPRAIVERVPAQLRAQLVEDPAQSPFHAPFDAMPASIDSRTAAELRARGRLAIAASVLPAFRRFERFFVEEYLPACRDSIALRDRPDGKAWYEQLARRYTTTGLTPEEIHAIGLREVRRVREQMQGLLVQTGFDGGPEAYRQALAADPRQRHADGAALLAAHESAAKRIDGKLAALFGRLPRIPYAVHPVPAEIAAATGAAYYLPPAADGSRPGVLHVNLSAPASRPAYRVEAITAHEAVPGHHLQLALAQELERVPAFRRQGGYTAFVEGWAAYAETLGPELGLYRDPASRFGALDRELRRAVLLVADSGLHYLGWSRERTLDYLREQLGDDAAARQETLDRLVAWPAQALTDTIGQLKFQELRRRARQALGPDFDLRRFHDAVLSAGALPLDLLDRRIDDWITAEAADSRPTG